VSEKALADITARQEIPARLAGYFAAMAKLGASDLHIKAYAPATFRVRSSLHSAKEPPLETRQINQMVSALLGPEQQETLCQAGQVDLAWENPAGERFRINIFRQRGMVSLAVRRVTREIPTFAELHLPESIERIAGQTRGLVLLSGPTGCGKSTTIAAMLEHINATRRCHIITIEDPIEYTYADKKALISQREIGIDVQNFDQALRAMLREDPDILLIGEMRDRQTIQAALQAALTGHLVLGTVHASTAPQTIQRILEMFPPEARPLIRQGLAGNLQAVLCQRLIPCVKDGIARVPAVEILQVDPGVRKLIETGRDDELADIIASCQNGEMQSFSQSLLELIEADMIDPKEAYAIAPNPEELKMRLKGIKQSQTGLISRG
jgi:twitching motility protein PilT